jgi:hypothetical protein
MPGPSVSWLLLLGLVEDDPDALGSFGDASLQAMP